MSEERAVGRAVSELKRMIVTGELLPGQPIRQETMAAALGISRLPVREALRQLVADGLVTHAHNVGFSVARLNRAEFDQIYLMRRLLETEVIRSLPRPDAAQVAEIAARAAEIEEAAAQLDLTRVRLLNREFHFAIFRLSPLTLLVSELARLWTWAMPYHTVYIYDAAGRERLMNEHREMVATLERGDNERVVELMDAHRSGSESHLNLMLQPGTAVSVR